MPKKFLLLLVAFTLALFVFASRADVVTLKGGEKLEGTVLEETPTEVRMNVKVSANIFDERIIPRGEVDKIEKAAPDETAWAVLKTYQTSAYSLPAAQYDRYIAPLKAFTTQFPKSAHFEEAQKSLANFEEEKKRVDSGDLKLNGKWLSKEEAQTERYQINGLLTLNYMRSEQARGDLIGALNAFDVFERQFPYCRSYPDAVELAVKMMTTLKAQAQAQLTKIAADRATYEKAVAAAIQPARQQMIAAADQARSAADKTLAASSSQGLKWPPFLQDSYNAMRQIADRATGELQRLGNLDLGKMRQSYILADKAKQQMGDQDYAGADTTINQARGLWDKNELLPRIAAENTAAKNAAVAAAKPKATPAPATPEPVAVTKAAATPEDAPPDNPWLKIVLGGLIVIFGVVGFLIYRSIKGKANEVLE